MKLFRYLTLAPAVFSPAPLQRLQAPFRHQTKDLFLKSDLTGRVSALICGRIILMTTLQTFTDSALLSVWTSPSCDVSQETQKTL